MRWGTLAWTSSGILLHLRLHNCGHSSQFYSWRTTQQIAVLLIFLNHSDEHRRIVIWWCGSTLRSGPNWLREGESDWVWDKKMLQGKTQRKIMSQVLCLLDEGVVSSQNWALWPTGGLTDRQYPKCAHSILNPWHRPGAMASKEEENIWGNRFTYRSKTYGKIWRVIISLMNVLELCHAVVFHMRTCGCGLCGLIYAYPHETA